jgi:hypothetical protein
MNTKFKKTVSVAVASAIVFSMTGCSFLDKSKDEVLDAADGYAKELAACNIGKLAKISNEDFEDIQEEWEGKLTFSEGELYSADTATVLSAIADSISYEIDEESVQSSKKKGEGSVDVVFSIADYAAAYEDVTADGGDLDAFIAAIGDADKNEIDVTLEFVLEDDQWLLDDSELECLEDVFEFYTVAYDYSLGAAISPDLIDYVEWYYSDEGVYTDPYTIELDIIPTTEGQEIEWEFWYEYYLDGQLVYTSDVCTDQGYWIESYYGASYDSAAAVDEDGHLVEGSYQCIVYDTAGNVLADSTCSVVSGGASTVPVISGGDDDMATIWENGVDEYWYSYSDGTGYAMGEGTYTTDETTMEFTCQVYDEANLAFFPVYYEVYYSPDGSQDNASQVYSATITPSEYSNGYFYEFQYTDNAGFDAGSYFFIGATDSTGETVLFFQEATVS